MAWQLLAVLLSGVEYMVLHGLDTNSLEAGAASGAGRAWATAREFESLFASIMVKAMRNTVPENPLLPASTGRKIFVELLDQEYARMMGSTSSLGLAPQIYRQLRAFDTSLPSLGDLKKLGRSGWMMDSRFLPRAGGNEYAPTPRNPEAARAQLDKWQKPIERAAAAHGVDKELVAAIIAQESGGNPYAVSHAGAKGMMQLMDDTARSMGVSNVFDAAGNIMGGTGYFAKMLTRFGGDISRALAAYNAGPAAVEKYGGIPPYRETQDYVYRVLNYWNAFQKMQHPSATEADHE